MKRLELVVCFVITVLCATFFAWRAWGQYPALFVLSCACALACLLRMREEP